jgi:hypothetical protein
LAYNLWADKALGLNIFPTSVYTMQSAWYKKQLSKWTNLCVKPGAERHLAEPLGVALDTRHTYTKSDWQMFTASFMPDLDVRNSMISAVKAYAASNANTAPLGDLYDTVTGHSEFFGNRPVVGGHLALVWAMACKCRRSGANDAAPQLVLNANATLSTGPAGVSGPSGSSPSGVSSIYVGGKSSPTPTGSTAASSSTAKSTSGSKSMGCSSFVSSPLERASRR